MILASTMWDDGLVEDLKLIDILRKTGATSAFAISPSRHKTVRTVNDHRGNYGELVSRAELKEFADFEICNHTDTHVDLKKVGVEETKREIVEGRKRLEDIFGREIKGFCYPYGVHTPAALAALREEKVLYARTTQSGHFSHQDNLLLHPTGRWNEIDLEKVVETASGRLILWGHTYELKNQQNWDKVRAMYSLLVQHPRVKLVKFSEMVRSP